MAVERNVTQISVEKRGNGTKSSSIIDYNHTYVLHISAQRTII